MATSSTKGRSVYERLRQMILSSELIPGQLLDQTVLSQELGVSRTPLRQALARLASEGLVESEAHKTARVSELSKGEMVGLYLARREIEPLLVESSAQNLRPAAIERLHQLIGRQEQAVADNDFQAFVEFDVQFHSLLYSESEYTTVFEAWKHLRGVSDRYILMYSARANGAQDSIQEHQRILSLVESHGQAPLLRHVVSQHVARGLEALLVQYDQPTSLRTRSG